MRSLRGAVLFLALGGVAVCEVLALDGDVVGDNPLNLQATTLGLNAYALGGGERFRTWALDYLAAWAERAAKNGGLLPSRVRSDGKVGEVKGTRESRISGDNVRAYRTRVKRVS